ncbi:MAG TPA: pilus assembly protein TadG-related protein [Archangium sp.]|nr:pilus assembly protein TadG-related protein [Archangium sp.]
MMTRALRRSLQRQEGQALVMACLLMLILSIALLTTVNIGHNVHERIRLQNTADAAAYSTAAMEARAFNFYAFTNRTQVSHYVSAMLWQSLNSFIFFVQAFLTDIYGFMRTIGPCFPKDSRKGRWIPICAVLDVLPWIGALMKIINTIFTVLQKMLLIMKQGMDFIDRAIGRLVVPGHRLLNAVMSGAAVAVMMASSSYVMGTSNTIIAANDPHVDSFIPQTLAGLINQCLFNRSHYDETTVAPGQVLTGKYKPFDALDPTKRDERDKISRAKRVMGGIANATRFPCNASSGICPETFVTSRKLGDLLPIPGWLQPLESMLNSFPKWGQTRMLTYRLGYGTASPRTGRNKIREHRDPPGSPMGMMAQGDVIGADDTYYIKIGPSNIGLINPFSCPKEPGGILNDKRDYRHCWGDPREEPNDMLKPSIWSMSDRDLRRNGIHWRVIFRNSGGASRADTNVGLYKDEVCVVPFVPDWLCPFSVDVYSANVRIDDRDNNHPWAGLAPFPHFEPGDYARDCAGLNPGGNTTGGGSGSSAGQAKKGEASINQAATRQHDFNQPSAWVMLNKDADELHNTGTDPTGATHNDVSRLNGSSSLTFNFGGSATLELDNDRKKLEVAGFTVASGMSVISRGQTYYHRPGNWTEHPNFFNPYWRPRLAAVWQGKESLPLVNQLANALPAAVKDAPAKIITH